MSTIEPRRRFRRFLGGLLSLALSVASAPSWAASARVAAPPSAAPAAAVPALGAALGAPSAAGLDAAALALPGALASGLDSPVWQAPALSAEPAARALAAPASDAAPLPVVERGALATPMAPNAIPERRQDGAAETPRERRPSAREQAGALAAPDGRGAAPVSLASPVFDGAAPARPASSLEPVLVPYGHPAGTGLRADGGSQDAAPQPGGAVPEPAAAPLPGPYKLFLGGLSTSAIGQAVSTILVPLFAHDRGPEFTALSCAIGLAAVIPGSWLGTWWVRHLTSKSAYIWSNVAMCVMFASLVAAAQWLGGIGDAHLLAFSAAGGVQYGMLRGVPEQDITVRTIGQEDEGLLKRAGALYYVVVAPVYMGASMLVGSLLNVLGRGAFSVIGAAAMIASAIPFLLIRYRPERAEGGEAGQAEALAERLPVILYLPYLFFWSVHYGFYYQLSPFFSLELFHDGALGGRFVAFYALGNLVYALLNAFAPGLLERIPLRARGWTALGVAATAAFLWTTLAVGSPLLSQATVFLFGLGVAAGLVQWKAFLQKRLSRPAIARVFNKLNIVTIVLNLLPLLMLYGAGFFLPGVSIPVLLGVVAAFATAAGVLLVLALSRGGTSFDPPSGKQ